MNVTYACPACEVGVRLTFDSKTPALVCPHCGERLAISGDAVAGDSVKRCLSCPSTDLYVRKDFPQRVGMAFVAAGVIGSSIAWYYMDVYWTFGILFATAIADFALYIVVGDALMCYRCQSQYRGVKEMNSHDSFDLEMHERYRQLAAQLEQ